MVEGGDLRGVCDMYLRAVAVAPYRRAHLRRSLAYSTRSRLDQLLCAPH